MAAFCRDCLRDAHPQGAACAGCGSVRLVGHPQLSTLAIAHIDCDAFYATVEKRDNPALENVPVIVGGGRRGVVTTACYRARTFGVRSAMPMFEARKLCPHAVVIPPDMRKYGEVARQVRQMMVDLTPLVEPLSIDEAFLDLSGTERLHGAMPAKALARFAREVETELRITVSVGLSANKFLAKVASDLDKPRGFAVLAPADAARFLADKPVGFIWGVGTVSAERMRRDGFARIADLQRADAADLARRYGEEGLRLARLAHGLDERPVVPHRAAKSISAETTFEEDIADGHRLEQELWPLCERVSARLKAARLAGATVTLKLKTSDFRLRTRAHSVSHPTSLAQDIFARARPLLAKEIGRGRFRLIGVGVSKLAPAESPYAAAGLAALGEEKRGAAEQAIDRLRARFGPDTVVRGLVFDRHGKG